MEQFLKAQELLAAKGRLFVKRPSVRGFYAFYSTSPSYRAYNKLEDAIYSGSGFYIRGLFGETWKVDSFSKVAASYVRDDLRLDNEIDELELMSTSPPVGNNCTTCMPVRYRAIQTELIAAVRAPKDISCIRNEEGPLGLPPLCVNKPLNRLGSKIGHGYGDMICCCLLVNAHQLPCTTQSPNTIPQRLLDLNNLFVVNGLVFERTYTPV